MQTEAIVEFRGIVKKFPGVVALSGVSLGVQRGECHGLVGENGAGKSTLGKILAGIYLPDAGQVLVDGEPVHLKSPRDALKSGIGMVHQELAFCENLSVAENLSLGMMPAKAGFLDRPALLTKAREYLEGIGATIDPEAKLGELPISQQQLVQIAAAVGRGARVLIFDEPTSSLSQAESERLFELIAKLKSEGVTSIYVSHRLEEVFKICDRITVLRDGHLIGTSTSAELDESRLVQMMIGRKLDSYYPDQVDSKPGKELLRVDGLCSPGKFEPISFSLKAGEILGFAGLVGSGRTQIAEALFGLDPVAGGRVYMEGVEVRIGNPAQAVKLGLGMVPEDRKRHGLVLGMTAKENITLPILGELARLGWVNRKMEKNLAKEFFDQTQVRAPGMDSLAAGLSGGNQQKLVLARWLAANCRVLIVDEPTRGVDVGAKAEIHTLIDKLAKLGSGIILISSELPEVVNLSTRVIVLREGRLAGILDRKDLNQESVLRLMAGVGGPTLTPAPTLPASSANPQRPG